MKIDKNQIKQTKITITKNNDKNKTSIKNQIHTYIFKKILETTELTWSMQGPSSKQGK